MSKRKTLHLNLKRKWFDMILSGEKMEEYREIKPSIAGLLFYCQKTGGTRKTVTHDIRKNGNINKFRNELKQFETITFSNGYSKNRDQLVIECKGLKIGEGKTEWGAETGEKYFVLELGEILEINGTDVSDDECACDHCIEYYQEGQKVQLCEGRWCGEAREGYFESLLN